MHQKQETCQQDSWTVNNKGINGPEKKDIVFVEKPNEFFDFVFRQKMYVRYLSLNWPYQEGSLENWIQLTWLAISRSITRRGWLGEYSRHCNMPCKWPPSISIRIIGAVMGTLHCHHCSNGSDGKEKGTLTQWIVMPAIPTLQVPL